MTATQARRIDEVAVVFNGKTPSKSEQRDGGHPVLKIKDVDALGRFRGMFSGYVDADLARKHVKQQLAGGETLVLNAAHNATHVASKTFYADQDVAGSLATGEWLIVRWSTEAVDSRYGNHWINVPDTRFRIRRLVNGIHLYPKDVARLQIPVPPLAEQKRIAGILDAADALRAKRREALAQLVNAAHNATHVASKTFYADHVAGSLATGEWLIVRWSTERLNGTVTIG